MMRILPLTHSNITSAAQIIASIKLFQQYDYNFDRACRHLENAIVDETNDIITADEGGVLAGFAWVIKNGVFGRSPYLKLIAVDQKFARKGIGRMLMNTVEDRYLSPNGLFILTTSTNGDARKFYETRGYRDIGELKDFVKDGFTEVIYFLRARLP